MQRATGIAGKYQLRCAKCARTSDPAPVFRCAECGGALEADINLEGARVRNSPVPEVRYLDFLPLLSTEHVADGASVATPCRRAPGLSAALGLNNVWIKDESEQPTGSTKDRLAALVIAVFRSFGITEFVGASTGNTALSLARAVESDGTMRAHFFCSDSTPGVHALEGWTRTELHLVEGSYDDAISAANSYAETNGIFKEGGFFNWARREGLKLAYLEAFDDMDEAPDVVVQAISSGMGMMAARKAADEYNAIGRMDKVPAFLMVQQETCAPMVSGWLRNARVLEEGDIVHEPRGLASAILLGDPRASYPYMQDIAQRSGGSIVAVSQDELRDARRLLGESEGLDVCYSSAATLAAVRREARSGRLLKDQVVLLNLTGRLRQDTL